MSYALLSQRQSTTAAGGSLPGVGTDNTFGTGTLNTKDCDDSSIVTLSSNQFTLATGTYRIRAQVAFGYTPSLDGLHGRAILYSITGSTAKTNKGTSTQIVGTPVVASDLSGSFNANAYSHLMGRFEVTLGSEVFVIRMAGDSGAGVWSNQTVALGAPASSVSSGSYENVYKSVEVLKE